MTTSSNSSLSDVELSKLPKHILLLAIGSMGDVLPFVNLGVGFRRHGHNVIIAANTRFRSFIEEKGFTFREINWDMQHEWENTDAGKRMVRFSSYSILGSPFMFDFLKQGFQKSYSNSESVLNNVDFVVLGTGAAYMYPECLVRNVPVAYICFYPWASSKSYTGAAYGRSFDSLKWLPFQLNVKIWKTIDQVATFWTDVGLLPIYNQRLEELGLPPAERLPWLPGGAFEKNQIPVIHALNRNLIQIQKNPLNPLEIQMDYPSLNIKEELKNFVPPHDLVEFLSQGRKPIYFGYGSMHSFSDAESRVRLWLEVMSFLPQNQRALFSDVENIKMKELDDAIKSGRVFIIGHIPHSWLFPQTCCVVHHGGSGTTHSVVRAGVPSVVVPHFADQPWWASILHKLGVAPNTGIQANAITADKLFSALLEVLSSEEIQVKASKVGSKIKREQKRSPVSKIVAHIEQYWEKTKWDVLTLDDEQQKVKPVKRGPPSKKNKSFPNLQSEVNNASSPSTPPTPPIPPISEATSEISKDSGCSSQPSENSEIEKLFEQLIDMDADVQDFFEPNIDEQDFTFYY
ncbi:2900_t:CDS:10 [Funneliformis geosporum]|uniref:2900_t:CDS:1 n=1 Tax=Funneliformis geosporum TaxID=1117311 RepID=A0A9W4SMZ5_9GLOM|nr:2900_t:CDS:10 [Funneliformis geosporum]